jgi:DNA polymerase V
LQRIAGQTHAQNSVGEPHSTEKHVVSTDGAARAVSGLVKLPESTPDTIELVRSAVSATKRLWQGGYRYSKAGLMLDGLVPPDRAPRALIDSVDPRRDALMAAPDDLNGRFG